MKRSKVAKLPPEPVNRFDDERWIPRDWTFELDAVASRFNRHVREQLPWYPELLACIGHVVAHYLPRNGLLLDVGASTGNLLEEIGPLMRDRHAKYWAIEPSHQMADRIAYAIANAKLPAAEVTRMAAESPNMTWEPFDVAVCNLVLMFVPVRDRARLVQTLVANVRPGGAIIFVDKVQSPAGYAGTVLRRMAMKWKLDSGTSPAEIVAKELSLGGVQRPIGPHLIPVGAYPFFRFGEFAGWVYERDGEGLSQ